MSQIGLIKLVETLDLNYTTLILKQVNKEVNYKN